MMAETKEPLAGEDKESAGGVIEHTKEFWKTHPSLWFEMPRSGLIETALDQLAHHPGLVIKTAKFVPGALFAGVGTAVEDIAEGKLDPSKKLSNQEIAEHVAINLATTAIAEVALVPLLGPAGALVAPALGAFLGDRIFNNFVRHDSPPSMAQPSTREMNPGALNDLTIPGSPWKDEVNRPAPPSFLDEPPAWNADDMASGVVVTVSGDSATGGSSGFGSGGGLGDGIAGAGAANSDQPRLALPSDVPHGSYAFTRFMLDGPDPEPAWLRDLRMSGLDGGDDSAQVPLGAAPAQKPSWMMGSPPLLGRPASAFLPPSTGGFSLALAPLDLSRSMAEGRSFGNGTMGSFFDARNGVPPGLSFGSAESSPDGIASIIAAIDKLGERLSERPVNAFLDGRDVTDIVNRHNARESNGPLGSTSAFDSSAGFTPYGARTE